MKQPKWNELNATFINKGRKGILGIVLHDTAGTGKHNDTLYLAHPQDGRKVSVDFTVERDGSIWKLNPDLGTYYCNHAGRNTSWRRYENAAVNSVTVGIEIVQQGELKLSPTYTNEQVASVAQLCAWICNEYKLVPSDITTHRQIITDGSRSDPRKFPFEGENGFWFYFWKEFKKEENFVASFMNNEEEEEVV